MSKIYLPLSLVAVAMLGACANDPVTPAPAPVVIAPAPVVSAPPPAVVAAPAGTVVATPTAIRAGMGRVETITALPPSAAAGGTTMRRYGIKMDDGTVQYVDTDSRDFPVGSRVQLTPDHIIKRP